MPDVKCIENSKKKLYPVTIQLHLLFVKSRLKYNLAINRGRGGRSIIRHDGLEKQLDIYASKLAESSALLH